MTENKSILREAICSFKSTVDKIVKDKNNPFFKSKYADLPTILDIIDKDLANNGLTLNSYTEYNEAGALILRTNLQHINSDEVITSVFPVFGNKPQEIGSSITYARRYNIQSLLNLAADDDDGNDANNSKPIQGKPKAVSKADKIKIYNDRVDCIKRLDDVEKYNTIISEKATSWLADAEKEFSIEYKEQMQRELDSAKVRVNAEKITDDILDDDIPFA